MSTTTTLSTAQKLQAHAARILGKPSSKVEGALLSKIDLLSEKLLGIEAEARALGDMKSATRPLTGAEKRAVAEALLIPTQFPPKLKTLGDVTEAVEVLIRFNVDIVELKRTYLSGLQNAVGELAAPVRAELLKARDELAKVQNELVNS